jgi:hypothetical protein
MVVDYNTYKCRLLRLVAIVLVADDLEVLRGCGIVVGKDSNYGGGE